MVKLEIGIKFSTSFLSPLLHAKIMLEKGNI